MTILSLCSSTGQCSLVFAGAISTDKGASISHFLYEELDPRPASVEMFPLISLVLDQTLILLCLD